MDGAPCGLAFGPDREIYVCNDGAQWVPAGSTGCQAGPGGRPSLVQKLRLDGSFTTLVSEIDGVPLHGANDIVFDPEGGFYFTDTVFPDAQGNPRAGHVCYATMDGRARRVHTGLLIPNGIGLTEDAKTLIVGETQTGKLIAFDVRAPGSLGPPRDFAQLTGGGKPDGLCLDAEGNVITTALGVPALQVFGPAAARGSTRSRWRRPGPPTSASGARTSAGSSSRTPPRAGSSRCRGGRRGRCCFRTASRMDLPGGLRSSPPQPPALPRERPATLYQADSPCITVAG